MRLLWLHAAALLVVPGLLAQGADEAAAQDPATVDYQKLVDAFTAANKEYSAKLSELTKTDEYKQALDARDRDKLMELRGKVTPVDYAAFVEQFQAGAKRHAGTDGAVPFLTWLVTSSRDRDAAAQAVDTLLDKHADSAAMVKFAEWLPYATRVLGADRAKEVCQTLAEKGGHKLVKAHAMYALASQMSRGRNVTASAKVEAEDMLAKAEELAAGTDLALRIQAPRFQNERLQIGMEVPDIAGEDLDGVPFKLSDYRGKVVVIDFWGDW